MKGLLVAAAAGSVALAGVMAAPALADGRYGNDQHTNGQNGQMLQLHDPQQDRDQQRLRLQDQTAAQTTAQTHDQTRDRDRLHQCWD